MSLDEVKAKHSVSQFVQWAEYFDVEANAFDKVCYYLAQLAMEVRRSYARPGAVVRVEDFILKFVRRRPERRLKTKVEVQSRTNRFKQAFFSATGLLGGTKRKG